MANREPRRPSLLSLFAAFTSIGLMSFGGGLTAWIRREIVTRRGWLDDQQFLSGFGLSQLMPGASNANLAVFIGAQLRGALGAVVAITGMLVLPVAIVVVLGILYQHRNGLPGGGNLVGAALAGMGAAAIGLNLGTGIRLGRLHLRRLMPALVTAIVAISIGVLGFSLFYVLLVMLPLSLLLAWLEQRE
jgi:chromate transporter